MKIPNISELSSAWDSELLKVDLAAKTSMVAIDACTHLSYRVEHDLGNIAVAVMGNADRIVRTNTVDSDTKIRTDKIKDAMTRGLEMTSRLGNFRSSAQLFQQTAVLQSLIENSIAKCRLTFRTNIELKPWGNEIRVPIDNLMKLSTAITNMIENSSDSTIDCAGKIEISSGLVRLGSNDISTLLHEYEMESGEFIYISVRDNGEGIQEKAIPQLFFPAFSTRMRRMGFGLSDVYGTICRLYRGGIGLWTAPAKGSAFVVFIPRTLRSSFNG